MNTQGKQYTQEVNTNFNKLSERVKSRFKLTDSDITERIMRLGIEARMYHPEPNELATLARTTLKEDFVTNNK